MHFQKPWILVKHCEMLINSLFTRQVEGSIDVNINSSDHVEETQKAKEEPAWLSQASSFITAQITSSTDADAPEVTR